MYYFQRITYFCKIIVRQELTGIELVCKVHTFLCFLRYSAEPRYATKLMFKDSTVHNEHLYHQFLDKILKCKFQVNDLDVFLDRTSIYVDRHHQKFLHFLKCDN